MFDLEPEIFEMVGFILNKIGVIRGGRVWSGIDGAGHIQS